MFIRSQLSSRRQILRFIATAVAGIIAIVLIPFHRPLNMVSDNENHEERVRTDSSGNAVFDVLVFEREENYEAIDSSGDRIESGANGWEVLSTAVEAVPSHGSIYVEGEYNSSSTIEIEKSIRMAGPKAFINHDGDNFIFFFMGAERFRTSLSEATRRGDNSLTLTDTADIEKGDIILLEDEDGDAVLGRGQPPGEPHSVLEVNGDTVRLEDSIVWRGSYPSGTLVYVIDPIEVHVSGFTMEAPAKDGNYYGIGAFDCRDSTFEQLKLDKFGSRAIAIEGCANFRVRDCTILQSSDIEASDGYGVQVRAGCHDIVVEGCVAKDCRHPLSVTPAGGREVASRSIIFRDCFVTSDGSAALNCHGGGAHDLRFEGCTVHTIGEAGVRTGAQQTNVSACEFRMDDHHAITTRNDGQEMILTVTDTDIYGAGNAIELSDGGGYEFEPLWKLVHLDGVRAYGCNRFFELGSGSIDRVRDLVVTNCFWDEVRSEGFRIRNQIDGGIIEGNDFGESGSGSHFRVYDSADADVHNLHIINNTFWKSEGDATFIRLAQSRYCVVSENVFESGSGGRMYADDAGSNANLVKQNTYYTAMPATNPVALRGGSYQDNNYLFDTSTDEWS